MLQELLTELGYDVVPCVDGDEAWDALSKDDHPELAILDWMMPGIDGLELCRRLRASPHPETPYILLLTVRGGKEDMVLGLQAGADDYLTKPFDREEMRARIRVGERIVDLQRQRLEQETRYYVTQLEKTVAELQDSRSRIVGAQEEVRRAIAEELHGHVQTRMTVLSMRLADAVKDAPELPEELRESLEKIAADLDDLRENEIRQLSHRLHPSIIRLNLSAGLRFLQDQYERAIPISLDISEDVQGRETGGGSTFPLNVRLGLYRVVEEALGNAMKHSEAKEIEVRLWISEQDATLNLTIQDDGRGFVPDAETKRSIGLLTIQDYISAIGGEFTLDSAPGRGTKISACVPMESWGNTTARDR
ncbi:MAG: response regulator [Chloroflexi bacterium]|nr:response regulator [Chloroflexota bacterium]